MLSSLTLIFLFNLLIFNVLYSFKFLARYLQRPETNFAKATAFRRKSRNGKQDAHLSSGRLQDFYVRLQKQFPRGIINITGKDGGGEDV